jgi:hypothetical protein
VTPARLVAAVLAVIALAGCGAVRERAAVTAAPASQSVERQSVAADLPRLTTAQAGRRAERVAVVTARGSRVVEGAPGMPFTRTTFAVRQVLKGHLPRRFVLQTIGGRLGDVVVDSPVPHFARSRAYVLFLGPDGPAGPTIFPQVVLRPRPATVSAIRRALR